MGAYERIRPSESQAVAEAQAKRPKSFIGLDRELAWFRSEWQADLPRKLHEQAAQVESEDHLGGPRMTERFEAYIGSGIFWHKGEPVDQESPRGRIRHALASMAHGGLLERVGARYLFALACRDFDVVEAGLSLTPPLMPEHAPYYAEKAISRLREVMERMERQRDLPWQMTGRYREVA